MVVAVALVLLFRFFSGLDASSDCVCASGRCFQVFKQTEDFPGAQRLCEKNHGQLLNLRGSEAAETLLEPLRGVTGRFWLELRGTDDKNCPAVSVTSDGKLSVLRKPCGEKLDGLLCQNIPECPCGRLDVAGGAQLRYIAHTGGELSHAPFPPGTIVQVKKIGEKYLDSKHLCYGGKWLRAPWTCEVMTGGCDHSCSTSTSTHTCTCPGRSQLLPNGVSCGADPCANCSFECKKQDQVWACACPKGYQLDRDGKTCLDVNECEDGAEERCPEDGEECVNTPGGAECRCREGFEREDGECVDVSVCQTCEHLKCVKNNVSSKYECTCRKGFRVKPSDPSRCELFCPKRSCPADCVEKPPETKTNQSLLSSSISNELQCYCPSGYIKDVNNGTAFCTDVDECKMHVDQCEHLCENTFGHYRCLCHEGFELQNDTSCVKTEVPMIQSLGSSTDPEASPLPALVPPYVKTGSVLGITVFVLACVGLMCFLVRNMWKRCSSIPLSTLTHSDINIFHLQQVTTETYKRLSVDKQMKSDCQKV